MHDEEEVKEVVAALEEYAKSKEKFRRGTLIADAQRIMRAFKAKRPVFRLSADFREKASQNWSLGRDLDWFSELAEDPQFRAMLALHGRGSDMHSGLVAWVTAKLRTISATSNWFAPSEGLTYKLLATELKGAVVGDLKLPMKAFYVELPDNLFYLEDAKTGWHCVRSLVVAQGCITPRTLEIAARQGDTTAKTPELGERLLIEAYGEPNENSSNPFDDTWLFKTYLIDNKEEDVESAIERSTRGLVGLRDRTVNIAEYERTLNSGRLGERTLDGLEIRNLLLRFVLNLCIYMGSEKAAVKHVHADEIDRLHGNKKFKNLRKRVQEKIQQLRDDRVFAVGTNVSVDAEMREIIRTEGTGGYKLTYRTLVRGHWRNQAHGPGYTLRTRKWIEPHVRGADLPTEVVGHSYKVGA
jgi:hypothetical protein